MEKVVSFALEGSQSIRFEDYDDDEFAIAKMSYLGSNPNSHQLDISEDVLEEFAGSARGKWLVSKMNALGTDMKGHEPTEQIMGMVPVDQEVEFFRDEEGYLRASLDVVVSKIYAKDFCKVLEEDGTHAVSVEMTITTENGRDMNDIVTSFNIVGITVLGRKIAPSCKGANIEFVRFAEEAETYFGKTHMTTLQKFAQERKANMEKKNTNIAEDFSVIDKEESRKEGESKMAEIEFAAVNIGDLWSRLWDALYAKYPDTDYGSVYRIKDIYEDGNQKFVLVQRKDEETLYRLDFSLTEEALTLADEIVKVEIEIVETDEVRKFAEPEDAEKYKSFADEEKEEDEKEEPEDEDKKEEMSEEPKEDEEKETQMSADEMMAKIAELEASNADKDNIIMQNETELAELREFKKTCMEAERATKVETVMSSVASYMDDKTAEDYRTKGMACEFAEVDAWANEVKAVAFEKMPQKKAKNEDEEFIRMGAPIFDKKKNGSVWDRL